MKALIAAMVIGSANAESLGRTFDGCSIAVYREALDLVEEKEKQLSVGSFCRRPGIPMGQIQREFIQFKELNKSGGLFCKLRVRTEFTCVGIDW